MAHARHLCLGFSSIHGVRVVPFLCLWSSSPEDHYLHGHSAPCRPLPPLGSLRCTHVIHDKRVGGTQVDNSWTSASHAAYPADLNLYIARVLASLVVPVHQLDGEIPTGPPPARADDSQPTYRQESEGVDEPADDAHVRPPPLPHGLPDRTPDLDTGNAFDPPPSPAASPGAAVLPTAAAPTLGPRYPNRLGGERGMIGTPIATRSRTRAAGSALLVQRGPFTGSLIKSGTGCMRKVSSISNDPRGRKDALSSPDADGWVCAEKKEIANHDGAESWKYIRRDQVPQGRRLVRLIWVYKRKRNGSLKARLCVQGCAQVAGVDFHQTFCGALRSTSLRLLASVAAKGGMRMHRYDFVAAFLQGSLEPGEVIYCHPPPGYESDHLDSDGRPMVCEVRKPVYGMAQAGRRWQRSLYPWLREFGFSQSHGDANVFHMSRGD